MAIERYPGETDEEYQRRIERERQEQEALQYQAQVESGYGKRFGAEAEVAGAGYYASKLNISKPYESPKTRSASEAFTTTKWQPFSKRLPGLGRKLSIQEEPLGLLDPWRRRQLDEQNQEQERALQRFRSLLPSLWGAEEEIVGESDLAAESDRQRRTQLQEYRNRIRELEWKRTLYSEHPEFDIELWNKAQEPSQQAITKRDKETGEVKAFGGGYSGEVIYHTSPSGSIKRYEELLDEELRAVALQFGSYPRLETTDSKLSQLYEGAEERARKRWAEETDEWLTEALGDRRAHTANFASPKLLEALAKTGEDEKTRKEFFELARLGSNSLNDLANFIAGVSRTRRKGVWEPPTADSFKSPIDKYREEMAESLAREWEDDYKVTRNEAFTAANTVIDEGLTKFRQELVKEGITDVNEQNVSISIALRFAELEKQALFELGADRALLEEGKSNPEFSRYAGAIEATAKEVAQRKLQDELVKWLPEAKPSLLQKAWGVAEKILNLPFIPISTSLSSYAIGLPVGKKKTEFRLASLREVEQGGSFIARPIASEAILPALSKAAYGGETVFEAISGIESHGVSGAITGKIAEDITADLINPAYMLMALPFLRGAVGTATGIQAVLKATTALTMTGLEPDVIRGVLRGATYLGRYGASGLQRSLIMAGADRLPNIERLFIRYATAVSGEQGGKAAKLTKDGEQLYKAWSKGLDDNVPLKDVRRILQDNNIPYNVSQSKEQLIELLRQKKYTIAAPRKPITLVPNQRARLENELARIEEQLEARTTDRLAQNTMTVLDRVARGESISVDKLRNAAENLNIPITKTTQEAGVTVTRKLTKNELLKELSKVERPTQRQLNRASTIRTLLEEDTRVMYVGSHSFGTEIDELGRLRPGFVFTADKAFAEQQAIAAARQFEGSSPVLHEIRIPSARVKQASGLPASFKTSDIPEEVITNNLPSTLKRDYSQTDEISQMLERSGIGFAPLDDIDLATIWSDEGATIYEALKTQSQAITFTPDAYKDIVADNGVVRTLDLIQNGTVVPEAHLGIVVESERIPELLEIYRVGEEVSLTPQRFSRTTDGIIPKFSNLEGFDSPRGAIFTIENPKSFELGKVIGEEAESWVVTAGKFRVKSVVTSQETLQSQSPLGKALTANLKKQLTKLQKGKQTAEVTEKIASIQAELARRANTPIQNITRVVLEPVDQTFELVGKYGPKFVKGAPISENIKVLADEAQASWEASAHGVEPPPPSPIVNSNLSVDTRWTGFRIPDGEGELRMWSTAPDKVEAVVDLRSVRLSMSGTPERITIDVTLVPEKKVPQTAKRLQHYINQIRELNPNTEIYAVSDDPRLISIYEQLGFKRTQTLTAEEITEQKLTEVPEVTLQAEREAIRRPTKTEKLLPKRSTIFKALADIEEELKQASGNEYSMLLKEKELLEVRLELSGTLSRTEILAEGMSVAEREGTRQAPSLTQLRSRSKVQRILGEATKEEAPREKVVLTLAKEPPEKPPVSSGEIPESGEWAVIPTSEAMLGWVKSLEHFMAIAERATKTKMAAVAHIAGEMPPLKTLINWVNYSALADESPVRLVAAGMFLKKEAVAQSLEADKLLLWEQEKRLFKFTNNVERRIVSKTGRLATPEAIVVYPDDFVLSKKQSAYVDRVRRYINLQSELERRMGVKLENLYRTGDDIDQYFHREVMSAPSIEEKRAWIEARAKDMKRVTGKAGYMEDAVFRSMEEGIREGGVEYMNSITGNVMARVRAGNRVMLDMEAIRQLGSNGLDIADLREIVDRASKRPEGVERVIDSMAAVNSLFRPFMTAIDFGWVGLQATATIARNPVAALESIGFAVDGLVFDQRLMTKYISNNIKLGHLPDFINNGGMWAAAELSFDESLKRFSLLGKVPAIGPLARGFEAAFSNSLNVMGLELYKGMIGVNDALTRIFGWNKASQMIARSFNFAQPLNMENEKSAAASVANKMTLRLNTAAMGISRGQREIEAAIMFAPRYYRAFFGLMGDAIQGGMRGAEARRAFGQMFGAFFAMNWFVQHYTGQSFNLDPGDRNFMTLRVGDKRVGPGGPLVSFIKLVGQSGKTYQDKDKLLGVLNPNLISSDLGKNPLLRWGRGKLSPIASMMVDFFKEEDFLGEPITRNWEGALQLMERRLVPFAAQAAIDVKKAGGSWKEAASSFGLEFFGGARTWPISTDDKLDEEFSLNEIVKRDYENGNRDSLKINWEDQRDRDIIDNDPILRALNEQAQKEDLEKGTDSAKLRQTIIEAEEKELRDLANEILGGNVNAYRQWIEAREKAIIRRDEDRRVAALEFADPKTEVGRLTQELYNIVLSDPKYKDPVTGKLDWERYNDDREKVYAKMPPSLAEALRDKDKFYVDEFEAVDRRYREANNKFWDAKDTYTKYKNLTKKDEELVEQMIVLAKKQAAVYNEAYGKQKYDTSDLLEAALINARNDPKKVPSWASIEIIWTAYNEVSPDRRDKVRSRALQEFYLRNPDILLFNIGASPFESLWDTLTYEEQQQYIRQNKDLPLPGKVKAPYED